MNDADAGTVTFGPFRLFPASRTLEREGVRLVLGDRALDILMVLIEHAGTVVSHKMLIARVWRGLVVEQGNLRVHIAGLRKALGAADRYIANVPGQGYCFVAPIVRETSSAIPAPAAEFPDAVRKRLLLPPKPLRMLGRDEIVRSIAADLIAERFVTLIGSGGIGKTTVAVAVAHAMREEFGESVCFVDLGAVVDAKLVPDTIASSLGLAAQTADVLPTLLEYLRTLRILLVLDNCEHVIDIVATLAETIFRNATGVHMLATSREAMRVEGEHVYWLPALPSPSPQSSLKAADVRTFPAVELFMERAAASGSHIELNDDTAPVVAGICGRLEGIALAIELAAGRVGSHGLAATADLLNRNLGLDWHGRRTALPRHQTLRALLDWSYGLLCATEQTSLRCLAALVGEFTLDAAAAVTQTAAANALDILDALVAKSLVAARAGADGSVRYRLLETTRLHALEKLQASGEADITSQRHARHFLALLDSRHGGQIDLEYTGRAHSLREHLGNVRAALEWCFSREQAAFDTTLAIELAAAATPVFFELSLLSEACKWSAAALAMLDDRMRGSRREMLLMSTWAISSMWTRGNSDDVLAAIARGLELARPLNEPIQRLRMLATRHVFLIRVADFRGALSAAQQWNAEAQQSGDITCLVIADLMQGVAHHFRGDQATAKRHLEAGFARAGARNLQLCGIDHRVRGLITLARVHWLCGDPEQAAATARLAIDAAMRSGKPLDTCFALLFTAPVHLWCGNWQAAQDIITQLNRHTHWHLLKPFHPIATAMQGALLIGRGQTREGTPVLLDIFQAMREEHQNVVGSFLACWAADGLVAAGRAEDAAVIIRRARRDAVHAGEAVHLPELLRIQAEALLAMSAAHEARAMRLLTRSCRIAHRHRALSWELRSAISLARIQISRSRHHEARELLAEIFCRFSGGFATRDLVTAREMLDSLRDPSADSTDTAMAFHHPYADARATDSRVE